MSIILRRSILVLIFSNFSVIKAGTCSTKMKNQCTKNTSLKPETVSPPEHEVAPNNAITYDQWSRLNTEIMSRVLAYLKPKELKIILLSSSKEKTDGHVNELQKALLLLTTDENFRFRFPHLVWKTVPPKIKGKQALENAWSCVSVPRIAKDFGEILTSDKTYDEKIAEMKTLNRVIKEQNRYAERQLEMSKANPVLRVWINLMEWYKAEMEIWAFGVQINDRWGDKFLRVGDDLRPIEQQITNQIVDVAEAHVGEQILLQLIGQVENQVNAQVKEVKDQFYLISYLLHPHGSAGRQIQAHVGKINQAGSQVSNQVEIFLKQLVFKDDWNDFSPNNIRTKLIPALPLIVHYAFLVLKLNAHFQLDYSFLRDLDIPSDFDDFIPTLKESIKTHLSLLEDNDANFLIRNELQCMLDHFPDEG